MRRAAAWLLLLISLGGCRQESPLERAARIYRKKQEDRLGIIRLEAMRFARMPDVRMIFANQRDGLGLAIRAEKTELRVGEPLHLHIVYANISAHDPISAAPCQGFTLSYEDETLDKTGFVDIALNCPANDLLYNSGTELPHGQLRTADISTANTPLVFHPGVYIVSVGWQSFRLPSGGAPPSSLYSSLSSNPILITVRK